MGWMSQKEEHTGRANHLEVFMLFIHLLIEHFSVGDDHKQKQEKKQAHQHNLIWKPHIQTAHRLE